MASCSSPRPCTSHVSARSVGLTRIETLPTTSWSRRFLTRRGGGWLVVAPGAAGEVGDERPEPVALLVLRRRYALQQEVEERAEVRTRDVRVEGGLAGAAVCVDDGEVDLLLL